MNNETISQIFGEPISVYTRNQAIEDGVLVSGMEGDLLEVSRQHYRYPIAMTSAVWEIIEKAVANPNHCNDLKGVWHDILCMSKVMKRQISDSTIMFRVVITGAARNRNWDFKMVCGPDDKGEPCMTIMLPTED